MCRRLIFLCSVCALIALAGTASAYDPGVILLCDAEGTGDDAATQEGWAAVGAGLNLDVNDIRGVPSPIDVTLATGNPLAIDDRYQPGDTPPGPLRNVEQDFWFANDENKSPFNDFILTLGDLQDGFYRVKCYLHRSDEPDKPCYGVTVTGAASVLFVPPTFMQDHAIMTLPAEIVFEASGGGDVVIRFKGPDYADPSLTGSNSPQIYFNGFVLEYFGASNALASGPGPADRAENQCSGSLSWAAADGATSRDVYFGTSPDDVVAAATPVGTGLGDTAWSPPGGVALGKTYYWRIDEDTGGDPCMGIVWRFTTNDGGAYDLFPGDTWRGVATDAVLSWGAGCGTASHDVYMSTSYADVASGAAFIQNQVETSYDPGGLELNKTYYWRIDERKDGSVVEGDVLEFETGFSGVVLYYKFDGTLGASFGATLTDDSGNNLVFTTYEDDYDGSLTYGQSNPAVNSVLGTSASFEPNCGLYRLDTGDDDVLRLTGYQYTIEMWVKANEVPDADEDDPGAILFGKSNRFEEEEQLTYAVELRLDRGLDFFHRGAGWDAEGNNRQNWRVSAGRGAIKLNEWYHIAAVWDISDPTGSQKLYIDGGLVANARIPEQNTDDSNAVAIGMEWTVDSNTAYFFDGLIDELRVSTVALGPDEFLLVPGPEWARNPSPAWKETRVDPNADLQWTAGTSATSHDIYFGTSLSDVNESATPYVSGHLTSSYDPGPLEYGTTYYWRVDGLNGGGPWPGVVWWFRTRSHVDDPNLLLWYEFEETSGYEAWDSSGHDYIGEVRGPQDGWDPNDSHDGFGGCRVFDDDTSVIVEPAMMSDIYKEITISVWLKDAYKDGDNWVFDTFSEQVDLQASVPDDDGRAYFRAGAADEPVLTWDFDEADPEQIGEWHHWAFQKNENEGTMKMYFDSRVVDSNSSAGTSLIHLQYTYLMIGAGGGPGGDLEAKMDDFRVYDYALSDKEVEKIYRLGDLARAWAPTPFNGGSDVDRLVGELTWKPGDWATAHEVYFGTDFNDVNDADTTLPVGTSVYKGKQALDANSYSLSPLILDTMYYWRIDEVNDPNNDRWKGHTWRFRVADYIVIEDFESFDFFENYITDTWLDGARSLDEPPWFIYVNGAAVFLGANYTRPASPVRGGEQSMLFGYINDGWGEPPMLPYHSEVERIFDSTQDWTVADVKILTLFFYGDPNNDANATEQMYVTLRANDVNATVEYGYYPDEDMNDIKKDEWTQWDVALTDFSGLDLSVIQKMYIGFGDKGGGVPGGYGDVHFDDFRLYLRKCVPWRLKPAMDFTDDCKVDFSDVQVVANEWLRTDVNFFDLGVVPQEPSSAGMVAWWKLEQSDGTTAVDYKNGYNGVLQGSYKWTTGHNGGTAVNFDNGKVIVADAPALRPQTKVSVSAWVYYLEEQGGASRIVVKGADNKETFSLQVDSDDEGSFLVRDVCDSDYGTQSDVWREEWIHLAGTFDGDSNTLRCFVNGQLTGEDAEDTKVDFVNKGKTLSQDPCGLAIGNRSDANNRNFEGIIDDVRLYDYALSKAEVAWLASEGTGYVPLRSRLNFYKEEPDWQVINLSDLAFVADQWLMEEKWPPLP
ncbi:MAG: LamG-like jellyroll fold domain-containing protein [Planctomycetota bacterium]|jgi:hypothetical protein